jgi:hypothetical protein
MNLTPEDKLILSSVKIYPNPQELEYIDSLIPLISDWEYLGSNIINRGIGPLLFKKLPLLTNNILIPEKIKSNLQQAYYRTLSRSTILYDAFRKVTEAFNSKGIQVIVLKGAFLSEWLYKDIGLRQFSDIDLLLKKEDSEDCLTILTEMGFKPFDDSVSEFIGAKSEVVHLTPMVLNDVSVEIHIKLHLKSKQYNIKIDKFIENSIPVTINRTPVYALQLNDLLIHLCVHLDKHFRGGDIQFTSFNDITNLLVENADTIDWTDFTNSCQIHECEQLVYFYILLTNKYFKAPVPDNIIEKYSSLLTEKDEELLCKYISGFVPKIYRISAHLGNIGQIQSFVGKARYLVDLVFPPKSFMIQKYGLIGSGESVVDSKNRKLLTNNYKLKFWWLWYPYRYWVGLKGLFNLLREKNKR